MLQQQLHSVGASSLTLPPSSSASFAKNPLHASLQKWKSRSRQFESSPSLSRNPSNEILRSFQRIPSSIISSRRPGPRLKVSAVFSSLGSPSGTARVNTAYKRVANCLVFPPLAGQKPRALIHFIGGAFIGAVPEVTYSLFIELLRRQGFLIIATPYNVTFEHVIAAELVHKKFQKGREALASGECIIPGVSVDDVANLPVFSVGHSNGALLQLLIGCIFQEGLPKASAVISFNNKPAADAVPYFEQLGPVTAQLAPLIAASPLLNISRGMTGDYLKNILNAASPVIPQYDKESLQSLQNFIEQIPLVLDQVSKGMSEFTPAPIENRKTIGIDYSVQNTLLVKYKVDALDESDIIEDILMTGVQRFGGSLKKITIDGNHITPCVQDIAWELGKVYTPFDAIGQLFRNAALSEIRETVASISSWFETFL